MKIAVNTWSLQKLSLANGKSLDEILELIARMDVQAVQTNVDYTLLAPYNSIRGYERLRRRVEGLGMELYSLLVQMNIPGAVRLTSAHDVVNQIEIYLAKAAALGCTILTMPPGDGWQGIDDALGHRMLVDVFQRVMPTAEEYGVKIGLEVGRAAGTFKTPAYALKLVKTIQSNYLTIVPDFEAWRFATDDLPLGVVERPGEVPPEPASMKLFQDCLPYSPYIHAKFLRFDEAGEEPHFPVPELIDAIKLSGKDHVLCVEYEGWIPDIDPHLDPVAETRKGVALLKRRLQAK